MSTINSREIRLRSRPEKLPSAENFELVETMVPAPQPGEILVKNLYMSVDPYMRGRMRDAKSYADSFKIGEAMTGGAVGKVIASQSPDLPSETMSILIWDGGIIRWVRQQESPKSILLWDRCLLFLEPWACLA